MSAIAGIYHFNKEPVAVEHIQSVMGALKKFPADDIRVMHRENLFLGCHAQWITPESIGEILPYYDHERQLAITADCIIDNREELFEKLQVKKEHRKTMSDSELILHAYYKWEEETPKHLIGDFAFMIWDEKKQKLFGARDFSGARTLYYYKDHQRFGFCTTIEPLLTLPYVKKELNEEWLAEFLAITGMVDVANASLTPYLNIVQLPPSHSISIAHGQSKLDQYCKIHPGKQLNFKNDRDYIEAFQEVFQEAVNCRLRTFREVGAQLSGGLDSGAVVSFAAKTLKKENKTLHTQSFIPHKDFKDFTSKQLLPNETPLIKATVNHVGNISDQYYDFEDRDSYTEIDHFLETMEMPYKFFENSFWISGMFEEANKRNVGVLLNGGRGNLTISWGSAMDYYAILLKKLKWIRLGQELNTYSKNVGGNRIRRLPEIIKIGFPILDRIFSSEPTFQYPQLINSDFAERTSVFKNLKNHRIDESGWILTSDATTQRLNHFQEVFHWNASNTIAAKLSLRYKLWKRDPTNDLRIISFCLSLPEEQYVQNGMDRALIRKSTEKLLPDEVRLNQRIHGVQGVDWVHRMIPRQTAFIKEMETLLCDNRVMKYMNKDVLEGSLKQAKVSFLPEHSIDLKYKTLMRSLIVYRFLSKFA